MQLNATEIKTNKRHLGLSSWFPYLSRYKVLVHYCRHLNEIQALLLISKSMNNCFHDPNFNISLTLEIRLSKQQEIGTESLHQFVSMCIYSSSAFCLLKRVITLSKTLKLDMYCWRTFQVLFSWRPSHEFIQMIKQITVNAPNTILI